MAESLLSNSANTTMAKGGLARYNLTSVELKPNFLTRTEIFVH